MQSIGGLILDPFLVARAPQHRKAWIFRKFRLSGRSSAQKECGSPVRPDGPHVPALQAQTHAIALGFWRFRHGFQHIAADLIKKFPLPLDNRGGG
jgi:hypothetical protein